ncbi:ankyrin repeat-containing protein [Tanacetum coccineum]
MVDLCFVDNRQLFKTTSLKESGNFVDINQWAMLNGIRKNMWADDNIQEITMSTNRDIGSSVEDLNTAKQDHKNSTASPSQSLPKLPCEELLGHLFFYNLLRREPYFDICVPLYQASISGDWKTAKNILDTRPELVRYAIAEGNDTTLHVAASAEETKLTKRFVKNLVKMMTKEDMEIQNKNDNTALCLAATAGNIKMVEIMLKKNPGLLTIAGSRGMLPLYMSALQGRHNTDASSVTSLPFSVSSINVALQIEKDHPELSTNMSIGVLARKPNAFKRVEKNLIRRIIHESRGYGAEIAAKNKWVSLLKWDPRWVSLGICLNPVSRIKVIARPKVAHSVSAIIRPSCKRRHDKLSLWTKNAAKDGCPSQYFAIFVWIVHYYSRYLHQYLGNGIYGCNPTTFEGMIRKYVGFDFLVDNGADHLKMSSPTTKNQIAGAYELFQYRLAVEASIVIGIGVDF